MRDLGELGWYVQTAVGGKPLQDSRFKVNGWRKTKSAVVKRHGLLV